jgi:glutathione S-transferase
VIENLGKRFDHIEPVLAKQPFLMGDTFTIADAYLFTILSWAKLLKVDLARWPAITSYLQRVGARPSVQTVQRTESQQKAAA